MNWLRRSLFALLAVGVVGVLGVVAGLWLLGSETGTAWALERLVARTSALTFGRARGSLLGGLVLEDVRVRLPRDELDVARLELDWDPAAALRGTLAFRRAAATSVAYRRVTDAAAAAISAPALPFAVRVGEATLDTLTVSTGGETATFGPTEFGASLRGGQLVVDRIGSSSAGFTLAGNAAVDLSAAFALNATVQWSGPTAAGPAAGNATLSGVWPTLRVRHELTAPFSARAEGAIDFAQRPRVDLAIEWRDLEWPGGIGLASPSGRMTLVGTVSDFHYDGNGRVVIDGREATFAARGSGSGPQLALERLELDTRIGAAGAGVLVADGSVDLRARAATLAVAGTDVNPAWWRAGWPGQLRGTAAIRAGLVPVGVVFDSLDIGGALRGYPLTLRGAAEYSPGGRWRLTGVRIASGANRVAIDGALTSTGLELSADADIGDLDLLWPGLHGAAAGRIAIGGSFERPSGRGRLVGRGLALGELTLAQVAIEGDLGGTAAAPLALRVDASGLARGPIRVARLVGTANGTTAEHRVTLDLDAEDWHAHAAGNGALSGRTWRGTLAEADFLEDLLGRWQLVEPAAVVLGPREVSLATACLEHESAGRWCGEFDVRGQPADRVVLVAQNFDLKTLRPLLPPTLSLEGVYQLSASLFDVTGNARGALVLSGEKTGVHAATGEQYTYAAVLDELRAAVTLDNGRLELLAALRSGEEGKLNLTAAIDDVRLPDSAIEGALSAAWPDIGFLALLAPELAQLGGSLTGRLTVTGTVNEPGLDGRAEWRGGRVAVPEWGLVVDGIEATAASRGERAVAFEANGHVGDGQVTLTGATELDPQAGWPTRFTLRGDSVRAVQLPEAEIFVTPDLAAVVAWPDVRVTGTVRVPRASLGLSALPAQAVTPSADAVVHGREGPRGARRLQLHAAVDLVLGDDVHYAGLDLDTKVTGALRIDAEPNRSAIAKGMLMLSGTYDAYGQRLTLERGQLLFSGPLDDPGVDVRAVRVIDSTRVGVELAGTIKSPRTRVFSTPSMSEADALSYLLFGRPVTGNGTEETATLETAALAMGLNQALPVVQRLGASLGLDELSVQTTATDAGALMAGKYVSPKLYIRYSYGLFNRIGGLLLRFKFNERLSIETRSGDQKSMDLLYTVEKD